MSDTMPEGKYADEGVLLPELRVYAESVNAAVATYRHAVKVAADERDLAILEALRTCQSVLATRKANDE